MVSKNLSGSEAHMELDGPSIATGHEANALGCANEGCNLAQGCGILD